MKNKNPICPRCGKYPFKIVPHDCSKRTNEPASSPLQSVVQGRTESPVPLSLDVQGTPDILAQLRARVTQRIRETEIEMQSDMLDKDWPAANLSEGRIRGFAQVLRWLDELAQPINNTAADTKSGSAGVP